MVKIIPVLILGVLFLGGCVSEIYYDTPARNEGKGVAIMYSFYEEASPSRTMFGKPIIMNKKYFSFAKVKNQTTGEKFEIGRMMGYSSYPSLQRYSFTSLPPGHYDVVQWGIGGIFTEYQPEKCGNIGFDITENDILVIKGLKPLSIGDSGQLLGNTHRANFVEFSVLPDDYFQFIQENHKELQEGRTIKVADLKSDNPAAFEECVRNSDNKYQSLGKE
jgi:hypothetical protein